MSGRRRVGEGRKRADLTRRERPDISRREPHSGPCRLAESEVVPREIVMFWRSARREELIAGAAMFIDRRTGPNDPAIRQDGIAASRVRWDGWGDGKHDSDKRWVDNLRYRAHRFLLGAVAHPS